VREITYTAEFVSFTCTCGTRCAITKYAPKSVVSSAFCQGCDAQYGIRWSEGILRKGQISTPDNPVPYGPYLDCSGRFYPRYQAIKEAGE